MCAINVRYPIQVDMDDGRCAISLIRSNRRQLHFPINTQDAEALLLCMRETMLSMLSKFSTLAS